MNEERLIQGLKKRDKEAFERFFYEYAPRIGSIAKSYLGTDDVDDIVQEVFIHILKGIKRFRGESKLSTWLYRITINVCNDFLKKRKRHIEELVDFGDEEEPPYFEPASDTDVVKEVLEELSMDAMNRIMEKLSPSDRLLITMRDVDGLSYEEMANILGVPIGTVKSRLHYARGKLRKLLQGKDGAK
ncbi:MAG: hypothetical protein PWP09_406 [Thermotogota bacterium]|nr:hypothetical protein [Thermotogota bacterium]